MNSNGPVLVQSEVWGQVDFGSHYLSHVREIQPTAPEPLSEQPTRGPCRPFDPGGSPDDDETGGIRAASRPAADGWARSYTFPVDAVRMARRFYYYVGRFQKRVELEILRRDLAEPARP